MNRKIFGSEIEQNENGLLNAKTLINAGNKFRVLNNMPIIRLQDLFNRESIRKYISEFEDLLGIKMKTSIHGRNAITWVHPYLFIKLTILINPKIEMEEHSWLMDILFKYNNNSMDYYKNMVGSLWLNSKKKSNIKDGVEWTNNKIKLACGVKEWENATSEQLELRDKIYNNISMLSDILKDNVKAVNIGILKGLENNTKIN